MMLDLTWYFERSWPKFDLLEARLGKGEQELLGDRALARWGGNGAGPVGLGAAGFGALC